MRRRFTVLVVDDSALVRRVVQKSLAEYDDIEVVGAAADPYEARDLMLKLKPDVLTLDIEMPRMDGLTFLKLIMKHRPQPVVIMSSLTQEGSEIALECLQEGAIDVIGKPSGSNSAYEEGSLLAHKIRSAATVDMKRFLARFRSSKEDDAPQPVQKQRSANTGAFKNAEEKLIVIGSSTGGTEALRKLFAELPKGLPPILVVQHIPAHFSEAFSRRLNQVSQVSVRQAQGGDVIKAGEALIAPGDFHMVLRKKGQSLVTELNQGPRFHYQRPAVDVLFDSVVRAKLSTKTMAIILTGMGSDGAEGMLALRQAGAQTLAQDRHTCVVYGMPREAVLRGGAMKEASLNDVSNEMVKFAQVPVKKRDMAVA